MKTRNGAHTPDVWVIAASFIVYRFLLLACPASFRREYGGEMSTLFRDCCRDAWAVGGVFALLGVWGRALIDLATTAASERMKEGFQMSRPVFIRIAGLAGLIAGAWYAFLFVALVASSAPSNFSIFEGTFAATWTSFGVLAATVPATWVLFLLGLLGLHLYLAQHADGRGWLIWSAALITGIGVVMLLVSGPLYLQRFQLSWPVALYLLFYLHGAAYAWSGFAVLGVGLLGTGWLALRTRALGRQSWVPLVAGVLALVNVVVMTTVADQLLQALSALHMPYPGLTILGIQLTFYLVWSVGWIFIGRRMWSHPLDSEAIAMNVSPAI